MNKRQLFATGLIAGVMCATSTRADERRFTYTYEPETLPQGAFEFENWVTWRGGRTDAVGQGNYSRWDLRQEIEYGVTDRYTAAFYVNESSVSYDRPPTGANVSEFTFEGVSIENRYMVLNPAEHKIGLTLYLEGTISGSEAEVETKIILGQRHGLWKWAFNLIYANEWEDDFSEIEGEAGASFGIARDLGKHWSVGLELRNKNLFPEYEEWESSAIYLGPTIGYRHEKFWAALSVLPQIYGWNNSASQDGNSNLDLSSNEKINVRLLFGLNF